MKQSETKVFQLGVGAGSLVETSNREDNPLPRLTLMTPWCPGYGEEPPTPANSFALGRDEVRQLYDALHEYYTGATGEQKASDGCSLLDAIREVETRDFRTDTDSGSHPNAMLILNRLRRMAGLPHDITIKDLPYYDGHEYVMPMGSRLLANQEANTNAVEAATGQGRR